MPQDLELVYEVETGKPVYMHSVDASEACGLGDYTRAKPEGQEPAPDDLARAMAQAQGRNTELHPEMMTPEQRADARAKANEQAALLAGVPAGAQVVVMAPTPTSAAGVRSPARSPQATASSASHAPTPPPATPAASRRPE